jgi:LuxR family maltose regulon positive regulatory protein
LTDSAAPPDLNNLLIDTQIALKGLTSGVEDSANMALIEPLTERELEILQLLSNGLSNSEIGQKLYVAVGTVKAHTSHIYSKLGVRNRVEAIARGRELSLLNHP